MLPCRRDRYETALHSPRPPDVYIAGQAVARRRGPRDRRLLRRRDSGGRPTWGEAERAGFTGVIAFESFSPVSMNGTSVLVWIGRQFNLPAKR